MKIRAAVLRDMGRPTPYAASRPIDIEEVELAAPGRDEVLVRIGAAGLCHSDLSVVNGSRPRIMPMVLGHEAAGEVIECGPGVTRFTPGDHVVFSFVPGCGHCASCTTGRPALCEPGASANVAGSLLSGSRHLRDAHGNTLNHHLGVSGFADHAVVSEHSIVRIDPDLAYDIAALFGCAVLTGVGAVVNTASVRAGESLAVFGLGGVGMAALLGARAAGAYPIVAVDPLPQKRALAIELGATHALAADADTASALRELTHGGAQHCIETVGNARVLEQAYAATRRGGGTISCGLPDPAQMLSISAVSLVVEERTLRGSYMGSAVPARDIPRFIALYRNGQLPVDRLLSHRLRLDELNIGFDRLERGEALRQVVVFGAD
jgi:Zn-dependent alcohol dehydrogenase